VAGLRDDLDPVAVPEHVLERHDLPVDLGAHALVADIGVHGIGEVHRRGALRQLPNVALGVKM